MSDEEIEGEGFVFKDSRSSQLSEDEALDQDSQAEAKKKTPQKSRPPVNLSRSIFPPLSCP